MENRKNRLQKKLECTNAVVLTRGIPQQAEHGPAVLWFKVADRNQPASVGDVDSSVKDVPQLGNYIPEHRPSRHVDHSSGRFGPPKQHGNMS